MKFLQLAFILALVLSCTKQTTNLVSDPSSDQITFQELSGNDAMIQEKVKTLLSKMTIEDKVGEMTQLSVDMIMVGDPYNIKEPYEFDKGKLKHVLEELRVGSILNNGGHARPTNEWHDIMEVIQDYAVNKKTTGIPVIYGIDAIHGANYTSNSTLFPQQLNLAATWNTELVEELAVISAYETRASATPWAFAPVLDVGRDPRWSRFWETFGEDVYMVTEMGKSIFKGMQGDDVSDKTKVAACMKHFLGYSVPQTGRDRTPSFIPERQLREYFLPPFKAAIDAGAKTIMINSGELNGIPVHADPKILKDLLRGELGFKGIAVTDWEDIKYLYQRHHIAKDYKDAVRICINAGIDMSMVPVDLEFNTYLVELVNEGLVPMSRIDESVTRILTLKYELGLFENSFYPLSDYPDFGSEKFRKKALQAAQESIVLLKNDNSILPISKNKKVLVTGPTGRSISALNGAWTGTWQGKDAKYDTPGKKNIIESLSETFTNINYIEGTSIDTVINIEEAVLAAKQSDIAIVCLGEMPYVEVPGNLHDLTLPTAQLDLVKAIAATGTPIVVIIVGGRPRIIREIEPLVDGILFAGLPGNEGGPAISSIVSGDYNPNGKLAFTYPRYPNDLSLYDYKGTELKDKYFGDNGFNPQWQFAHGLSYTSFKYEDLNVVSKGDGKYHISVQVTNIGDRDGLEIVPLYISDKVASVTPSNKRLRRFSKLMLKAGESQLVSFDISSDDLKFIGVDNKWVVEPGEFEVIVGGLKQIFNL